MRSHRVLSLLAVLAVVAGTALAWSAAPASFAASSGAGSHPRTARTAAASAEGERTTVVGLAGWQVLTSRKAGQGGAAISAPGFAGRGWLHVKPDDAGAPGTEIEALLQNGACPNVFYGENMRRCFGFERDIGRDTVPQFDVPWWFRTGFNLHLTNGEDAKLTINGIVGKADVWVDGRRIATHTTVKGDFTRYTFDITRIARPGHNALALLVYPNDPNTMFTLDDVDWNQIPPDNNTGIQFPIQLEVSHGLAIGDLHALQRDAPGMRTSALTVEAALTNTTTAPQTGLVSATVTPPRDAGGPIRVAQRVTVPAGTTMTVAFAPARYPRLLLHHPAVWWPYQMGRQPLYGLAASVSQHGSISRAPGETFGIRTITTWLTGRSRVARKGVRVFAVNGRPFLFRGGGWSENLFLHYSAADTANQIALIKGMGLNAIRTEGKQMPADFYEQMDRAGIMIDAGFQCCDRWQQPSHKPVSAYDYHIMYLSSLTIGENLRNHPSVINFAWSDAAPTPKQERVSLRGFDQAGFQDPIISSAEYNSSPILGPSGEKEGPYDWVPPAYWYDTTHSSLTRYDHDTTLTNVGGSWGFDSEESAGDTVPTMDSIRRFMTPHEQAELWRNPDYHQYHTNYEAGHHGYEFGTLFNFDNALTRRYGRWSSLAQFVEEAQVQNYENVRSQFEAFIDHWDHAPTPATGTDYWMMNKGWPTLLWDLYNNDYDEAGSYFGAQEADRSLHVLYAYDDGTVTVDNLSGRMQSGLSVQARVYTLDGRLLDQQRAAAPALASQGVANAVLKPKVPHATRPPKRATTYFVELLLRQHGKLVDRNVYWLSTQRDVVDWPATEGRVHAHLSQYANLRALQALPPASVHVSASTRRSAGDAVTTVTITNTSAHNRVAFFLRADVRRGTRSGHALPGDDEVLPVTWSSNDVTLWPGESETLTATYAASLLRGAAPVASIFAWNVAPFDVAAPMTGAGGGGARSTAPVMGAIVPQPVSVQPRPQDAYQINATTAIHVTPPSPAATSVADYLATILRRSTGFPLPVRAGAGRAPPAGITLSLQGAPARAGVRGTSGAGPPAGVGPQGYELVVSPEGVVVRARAGEGLFDAVQTLRQLLPAAAEATHVRPGPWVVPGGRIIDYPRYPYRGAMLDVARHFFTVAQVERYIDAVSLYKINYLHLHLSDDQGWRLFISGWPRLATYGGSTEVGGGPGGYYTQAQYEQIVAYARSRYVTIVPEIDMPGHTNAALASYAALNCDGVAPPLYTGTGVGFSSLCVPKPVTYEFIADVIGQLAALTPGPYIHFGGDEANKTTASEYKAFVPRVQQIIAAAGKTAMGWHNITAARLLPYTVAEYWGTGRWDHSVAEATHAGTRLVMAPASRAYLDQKYNKHTQLGQHWAGYIEVEKAYDWDPATFLHGVDPASVIGVEAPLWTETMSTVAQLEYMAFPRLPAIAELGWSPASTHSWADFRQRLAAQAPIWKVLGIDYYPSSEVPWR